MSLYKDPVTTLLGVVGTYNGGITLDRADYDFLDPLPNNTGEHPDQNSHVRLKANNAFAPFQGEVQIFYNRLDLADLEKLVDLSIKAPSVTTSHDLLPFLNDRFGLNITTSDVDLVNAVDHTDYKTVQLTAKATSLGWIGTVEVSVAQGDIPLENYLTTTALPGLDYPTPYATLPFAQMYSYWRDFSEYTSYLKTIVTGQVIPQELATILTSVTGDTWVRTGYSQFSLGGATIVWAGQAEDNGLMNNNYDYGIQVRLNHNDAFGITGDLIIHFSDPVDPMAQP
ncbi:hypothetical protein D3C78_646440 [compost metagenome]